MIFIYRDYADSKAGAQGVLISSGKTLEIAIKNAQKQKAVGYFDLDRIYVVDGTVSKLKVDLVATTSKTKTVRKKRKTK